MYAKTYLVPNAYENVTKKVSKQFLDTEIFKNDNHLEWVASTFIRPKKAGGVRVLTDS